MSPIISLIFLLAVAWLIVILIRLGLRDEQEAVRRRLERRNEWDNALYDYDQAMKEEVQYIEVEENDDGSAKVAPVTANSPTDAATGDVAPRISTS